MSELTKEAKDGLEWGVLCVEENLNAGINPKLSMSLVGIKGWEDTYFFFEYLRETGRKKLLKRLSPTTPNR